MNTVTTTKTPAPTIHDLYIWLPELVLMGVFLLGGAVFNPWLAVVSVLIAAWIVVSRAVVNRRNAAVLREYDQALIENDTRLLDGTKDGELP